MLLHLYQRCHCVSLLCFLHGIVFETQTLWIDVLFRTQCPVVIEEDTRRAVARHRSEVWLWVLFDQYRAGMELLLPQVCEMCFVIYREQKKCWENLIFTIRVLSRLTALLTWAASLGWTCCDLLQHVQGVPRTCSFYVIVIRISNFARPITQQIGLHMKCNQIQFSYYMDGSFSLDFVVLFLTCNNLMNILPPVSYTHLTLPTNREV